MDNLGEEITVAWTLTGPLFYACFRYAEKPHTTTIMSLIYSSPFSRQNKQTNETRLTIRQTIQAWQPCYRRSKILEPHNNNNNNNKNRNQSWISEIWFQPLNHCTNKKPRLEPRPLKAQVCSQSKRLPRGLWSLSPSRKLSICSGKERPFLECGWRLLQGCSLYHSAAWQEIWLCFLSQGGAFFSFHFWPSVPYPLHLSSLRTLAP